MSGLTWDQVRAWRVARSHLDERVPKRRIVDVVSDMCGVQAQVASAADLSLWTRVEGLRSSDVRDALWKRRRLVRTWAMRGTLHLLAARDLPLYTAVLGTHDRWWKGAWLKFVGLREPEFRRFLEAIREALSDEPLTREEVAAKVGHLLNKQAREHLSSGWGTLFKPAAFDGSLCSGPPRGQSATFVRPDQWLGSWTDIEPEEAQREIFRRYVHTFGPSRHDEFAAWWGTTPPLGRRMRTAIADELEEVDVDGDRRWALRKDVRAIADMPRRSGSVRLLPNFDAYVMGFRPREHLLEKRFNDRVFRKAGWISPVVLVDGRIAGVWSYERVRGRIEVSVVPFQKLSRPVRAAIAGEVDRLGAFLDVPPTLSFEAADRTGV